MVESGGGEEQQQEEDEVGRRWRGGEQDASVENGHGEEITVENHSKTARCQQAHNDS